MSRPPEEATGRPPGGPRSRRSAARRRRSRPLTAVAVVLLVLGLSCLGWVGWQYLGTNVVATRHFAAERVDVRHRWQQSAAATAVPASSASPRKPSTVPRPATVLPEDATALLRVPAFGADYEVPVVEGVGLDVLSRGVGHYPGSAAAGAVGNFAVAGHRVTHGQPFARLLELDRGDSVVVETASAIYTYVLDQPPRDLTVPDTASWVLDPVPGEPAAEPTRALLTLTTCQDLFHSADRSVGFGHLASTQNK